MNIKKVNDLLDQWEEYKAKGGEKVSEDWIIGYHLTPEEKNAFRDMVHSNDEDDHYL